MNGTGYFTNRKSIANPVSFLQLSNFSATLEGKPVRATVAIENFTKPRLDIAAVMEADLKALSRFFMPDTLEEISGKLFVDAKFKGIAGEKTTYRSSGDIRFEQVAFRLKQKPVSFSGLAGMLHLDGNDLVVDEVSGKQEAATLLLAAPSGICLPGYFWNSKNSILPPRWPPIKWISMN
ncbi:MAG: hypothetical protein IPL22_21870 [Bacteroidetes bacterium]|nr:hypothetical protein [Bacteroidota bacterium]